MDAAGIVDVTVQAGEAFAAGGSRLVATAGGVGAGIHAVYARNTDPVHGLRRSAIRHMERGQDLFETEC